MSSRIYDDFNEVEKDIEDNEPKYIYKYRNDWKQEQNRDFLIKRLAWFAAPRTLNDRYDMRVPLKFDALEVDTPEFYNKLKKGFKIIYKDENLSELQIEEACRNKMIEIKSDPKEYFEKNYRQMTESDLFDCIGLFSCTSDALNEAMWAYYGGNHCGYVVGFKTVELARDFQKNIGKVKYNDDPVVYSFIKEEQANDLDSYFQKSSKWINEKEFRFFSFGINREDDRLEKYSTKSVEEFILGSQFPNDQKEDFIKTVREQYLDIPIYQVQAKSDSFDLGKIRIA